MNYAFIAALAVAGGVVYTFLNVIIRRYVANVRSREDYDEAYNIFLSKNLVVE